MAELSYTPEESLSPSQEQIENQVAYKPRSKAYSLSTLAPASSLKGLDNVFNKIESTTGLTIDEYVRDRLNESSTEELFNHYAAEQIDSLALSIYNHEFENKATLVESRAGIIPRPSLLNLDVKLSPHPASDSFRLCLLLMCK